MSQTSNRINYFLELTVLILFSILYWIWILPETIVLRNISIFLGGSLSTFFVFSHLYRNGRLCILLLVFIGMLFIWPIVHYLFFSSDSFSQLAEITSIWKRGIFSLALGIGVGFVLNNTIKLNRVNFIFIFILGLSGPALIYAFKFLLLKIITEIPDFLVIYHSSSKFYIPKIAYVSFLLPAFAFTLSALASGFKSIFSLSYVKFFLILNMLSIIFVFFIEGIKNGLIWSLIFVIFFFRNFFIRRPAITATAILLLAIYFYKFFSLEISNFYYDAYLGFKINEQDHWMHMGDKWYPINQNGVIASSSTYDRMAWLVAGLSLIVENVLGYGLIQNSFGQIAASKWPGSNLHQTHSGWLDLTLGLGVPGASLFFLTELLLIIILLKKISSTRDIYKKVLSCSTVSVLFMLILSWITSELSQKVYFECALLWIGFGFGVALEKVGSHKVEQR